MKTELMNLFLFIGISLVIYLLFRNFNYNNQYSLIEGMTDASGTAVTPVGDGIAGIAGNAASYGAQIKAATIRLQDTVLISKYRSDYETAILNLNDLVDNMMLRVVLSIDINNPAAGLKYLADMNQSKLALNNVMKFVDKQ